MATLAILDTKIAITSYVKVNFRQTNKNIIFTPNFATFYFEIAVKWSKSRILKNSTPSKMHMNDMVTIDTIIFEIVGEKGLLKPLPPPGSLTF